jgi:hypothetical protein
MGDAKPTKLVSGENHSHEIIDQLSAQAKYGPGVDPLSFFKEFQVSRNFRPNAH